MGKPWFVEEENLLRRMVADNSARAISDFMGKSSDAVNQKIARWDLEVVEGGSAPLSSTTTSLELPKKLSSEEASLRMENAALKRRRWGRSGPKMKTSGCRKSSLCLAWAPIKNCGYNLRKYNSNVHYSGEFFAGLIWCKPRTTVHSP